jgi:LysR family transcriptional regulator, transcriptional activator for bauABCD operon
VGVIPGHRESASLSYQFLFDENMALYCGQNHPLFMSKTSRLTWDDLQRYPFVGLGYHSPNMALSLARRLPRAATAFDQEGIATLILSGQFIGFLPDHYAQAFENKGLMRALSPDLLHYACDFFSIHRKSPAPSRTTRLFLACLQQAHPKSLSDRHVG